MSMIITRSMSEAEIEAKVERFINHLDRLFLASEMSQLEYDRNIRSISEWADATRKRSAQPTGENT